MAPWSYALVRELPEIPEGKVLALDIETTHLEHDIGDVVVITVATPDHAWVIDVRSLDPGAVSCWLDRLFASRFLIVHNSIFDIVYLVHKYRPVSQPRVWDTKLVEGVIRGGIIEWHDLSLARLSREYLGLELDKSLQESFSPLGEISQEQVRYAAMDALVLHGIREAQLRELARDSRLWRVVSLEHHALPAFWEMQRRGVAVDIVALEEAEREWRVAAEALRIQLQERLTRRVLSSREQRILEAEEALRRWDEELQERIRDAEELWRQYREDPEWHQHLEREWLGYRLSEKTVVTEEEIASWLDPKKGLSRYLKRVGQRFRLEHPRPPAPRIDVNAPINLLSSQQLLEALNAELKEAGLGEIQSTEARILRSLMGRHAELDEKVLRPLLRYRELEKLLDFALQIRQNLREGRLYPDWQQIGAATGRASCRSPNLMAQPKGAGFRRAFVARPGMLVTADYSQIELRIMAALSGDPEMARAFVEGADLHALTASKIFGVSLDQVSEKQRKVAKVINFGTLYGMGPRRLMVELASQGIEISLEEAREALDSWRRTYRKAAECISAWGEQAVSAGFVETALGRKRRFAPGQDPAERAAIARQGGNHPIQGTAADIMKAAMGLLVGRGIVLQVHDELVLEVPDPEQAACEVEEAMRRAADEVLSGFPVDVDVSVSESWAEVE